MADPTSLQYVLAGSAQLTTWALAVAGGTIAVLVGAYRRPTRLAWRMPYLIFFPIAWMCLGVSVNAGNEIASAHLASVVAPKSADAVGEDINELYSTQLDWLSYALVVLVIWLVIYLIGWTFAKHFQKEP